MPFRHPFVREETLHEHASAPCSRVGALRAADCQQALSRRRREALGPDATFEQVCARVAPML